MKNLLVIVSIATVLAACSTPKYASHFPSGSTETGYHAVQPIYRHSLQPASVAEAPAAEVLTASRATAPIVVPVAEAQKKALDAYRNLSKAEKKEVRKLLKNEIKSIIKRSHGNAAVAPHMAPGGLDHDLKLAAVFGAVGLVGLLIGGNVFWIIGSIALIIGVVFFVKWLMRQ